MNLSTKSFIKYCISSLYYFTGRYKRAHLGKVIILMYHRVLEDEDQYSSFIQPGMFVRQSSFKYQLEFLKKNYEIISFEKFLLMIKHKTIDKNKQYCVITFDDGWRDNYQFAYPVLKHFDAPATIFLAESYIGTSRLFWHEKISYIYYLVHKNMKLGALAIDMKNKLEDDLLFQLQTLFFSKLKNQTLLNNTIESIKKFSIMEIDEGIEKILSKLNLSLDYTRSMLNWEEVKEMSLNDISFGSHTCEHLILTNISIKEATKEIISSKEKLESRLINFVEVFCYPNGGLNDQIKKIVQDSGYIAAVSTRKGIESEFMEDVFGIKRIGIHDDIAYNKALFAYRLR